MSRVHCIAQLREEVCHVLGRVQAMTQTDGVDGALGVFAGNAIYVGGYRSDGRTLHFLHGHPLPGAAEVSLLKPNSIVSHGCCCHPMVCCLTWFLAKKGTARPGALCSRHCVALAPVSDSGHVPPVLFRSLCLQLAPGVYFGGLEEAAEKVLEGSLPATDFRFFVG